MLLTMFSISNATGRVIAGWAPERMLHLYGTPRYVLAIVPSLILCISCRWQAMASWPLRCALVQRG